MLKLTDKLHEEIKSHGAQAYPFEGCGLLLGRMENGTNVVEAIVPAANTWPVEGEKPVRFQISSDDMLKAEMEAMRRDLDVIGIFHSHPDHPPVASPRDLAWATWPGYSYIITQVWEGEPTYSQSWQLLADRSGFVEEMIVETGD
ncbi:MAG: M67 family metallopeptidase [Ardenticatenaceae bacterium]|nr:M67 family metallopeptidase [Ardenticatenaceae bacterium]